VVAARKEVHAQVLEAVQAILAEEATRTQEGKTAEKSSVRFFLFLDFFFELLFDSIGIGYSTRDKIIQQQL
jgi:hypothetical protein